MNLLTAEGITHSYHDRRLFSGLSFHLNEGEKVGLIGINGTGKSTLLKIIAGMLVPDEGTVIRGNQLTLSYLPQSPEFADTDTVLSAALAGLTDNGIWEREPDAKNMLTRLGITEFTKPIHQLSGGQRKRVALVRTLLTDADILILDEPTNHLDSAMAEWLENKLKNYRGALVMITHDRYFLDSVVTRIVELEQGKLYSYADSYLGYLALKSERKEMEAATERKRQSLLKTEIQWMMRGARARSTKQKAHIARYEALRDVTPPKIDENVQMTSVASRLGRTTIELNGICKSYDDRTLIRDFSYIFLKNDRIGIIGPNGCGKSTLMKLINGIETPDSGTITIGQTVKIGYFSQENEYLDPSLNLLRILMEAPNVLFLDEPTNDLDIETLTILEDYLDHFAGIVVTVSHDRYFLDRVVRRIFAFEENGTITQYEGGYSDYLKKSGDKLSEMSTISDKKESSRNPDSTSKDTWKKNAPKKLKFSYKEQRDYETIEEDIQKLEEKITSLEKEMEESASNYSRLTELNEEKENAEMALLEKMERWEYLEDLAAQIENQ